MKNKKNATIMQLGFYKQCNIENADTAIAYYNLGCASDTSEEKGKCYNEALRIYKKCNIENADTAFTYYNLGKLSEKN